MDWSIIEQYPNISFWAFACEIESLHQIAVAYRIQSCISIRQTDYKNAQPETRIFCLRRRRKECNEAKSCRDILHGTFTCECRSFYMATRDILRLPKSDFPTLFVVAFTSKRLDWTVDNLGNRVVGWKRNQWERRAIFSPKLRSIATFDSFAFSLVVAFLDIPKSAINLAHNLSRTITSVEQQRSCTPLVNLVEICDSEFIEDISSLSEITFCEAIFQLREGCIAFFAPFFQSPFFIPLFTRTGFIA